MTSKIEWYREVLALEPGSRVFFPLAKLLAAESRLEEAAAALRDGLIAHPDHLEAKFFLIDVLCRLRGPKDCQSDPEVAREFADLMAVIAAYPAFWAVWAGKALPDSRDASLAVRFLAAHFQGLGPSFASVLDQGLAALTGSAPQPAAKPQPDQDLRGAAEVREMLTRMAPAEAPPAQDSPQPEAAPEIPFDPDASPFTGVRTRTMAEVLAAQGDVRGALEIYQELEAAAPEQDKPGYSQRAAELRRSLSGVQSAPAPDKNKLIGVLERLAGRLEARAGG